MTRVTEQVHRIDVPSLLRQVDLVMLVQRDGVQLQGAAEKYGPCPVCGGNDRFHVKEHNGIGYFFCRSCHYDVGGRLWHDAIDYLAWTRGMCFRDAVAYLGGWAGEPSALPVRRRPAPQLQPIQSISPAVREVLNAAVAHYQATLREHTGVETYLAARGLANVTIDRLQIGYSDGASLGRALYDAGINLGLAAQIGLLSPLGERMYGRVVFPVLEGPDAVYLIGRALRGDHLPKYLGLPDGPTHKRPMQCGQARRGVILVEGPVDYAALLQWGLDADYHLMALLGTAHGRTVQQLTSMSPRPRVAIALDQDQAGLDAAQRVTRELVERGLNTTILTWTGAKDCGELLQQGERGRAAFAQALAQIGA
jgi:DNA primase